MIAQQRILSDLDRLQMDRDAAVREVLTCTAGLHELSARTEHDVRLALLYRIEPILEAADALVVAGQELEAIDRRLDTHVGRCRSCPGPHGCWQLGVLRRRHSLLLRNWDRAYRRLVGGV